MKWLVTVAVACTMFAAGTAAAGEMGGRGPGGGGGQGGGGQGGGGQNWGQNSGVFVDVPWSAINNGNNSGIPPRSDYEIHCRDVRHSCFDQWGVSEPGYGQCMANRGC